MRGLTAVAAALLVCAVLWGQRTSRRPLTLEPGPEAPVVCDTIVKATADSLSLAGYDKPLRSRKETFFATNKASRRVMGMALTLNYTDFRGRNLHSRKVRVRQPIDPGTTINIAIPSWDRQQSFYYRRSTPPKRVEQATPFDVSISVDTIFYFQP